jgi:hypothetical protein
MLLGPRATTSAATVQKLGHSRVRTLAMMVLPKHPLGLDAQVPPPLIALETEPDLEASLPEEGRR